MPTNWSGAHHSYKFHEGGGGPNGAGLPGGNGRGACIDGRRALVPFEWTTVIAGGALPMPTLLQSLLPLVVGSPVLLRETKAQRGFGCC